MFQRVIDLAIDDLGGCRASCKVADTRFIRAWRARFCAFRNNFITKYGVCGGASTGAAPAVRLPAIYAGWVLVDTRLSLFVVGVALLVALGVLALFVKQRRWYEYAAFGFAIFSIVLVSLATVLALVLNRAPFLVESFFALP